MRIFESNKFWKVFFFIWSFLAVSTFLAEFVDGSLEKFSTAINLFQLFLGSFAMYGLAFQKRMGFRLLWRILFIFQIGFILLAAIPIISSVSFFVESSGAVKLMGNLLLFVLLFGPYLYGLYLYGYRRPSIWVDT